jgi:hypothetical protein
MLVPDWIEKIGRKVFESPFASGAPADAPELAEIRLALLDAARARCQRISGKQVFAFNKVTVTVRGIRESDEDVWRSQFVHHIFESELRAGLAKASVRFPEDLTVEVNSTPDFPSPSEDWISISIDMKPRNPTAAVPRHARLIVLQGTANLPEMPISKSRTNVGRTIDVQRVNGPSRRNDLAFSDESAVNRSVSREHAHIIFSKARGEYRLFNDRTYADGNCRLWILRDGLSQAVPHDARGVQLRSGDEIHFGSAVVSFLEDPA